jgi:transcription initiation factor IIE alpha subunit
MMARYKVFSAMIVLDEFCSYDLSDISGVKIATVRTIIEHVKDKYLEISMKKKYSRRGGQITFYRIKKENVHLIEEEIDTIIKGIRKATGSDALTSRTFKDSFELKLLFNKLFPKEDGLAK